MNKTYRFKMGKLVRDKIPTIIKNNDIKISERILDKDEFIAELKTKLIEEANELYHTQNLEDFLEEMADVMEVVSSLCKVHELSLEDVEHARNDKNELKGGFENRIFCESVEVKEDNSHLDYYLKHPEKYPAIK